MGSVKDLSILKEASNDKLGSGRFYFSDRYSVFDYGEMPDSIPYKGNALAVMSAFNFEKLEEIGIKTHYKGLLLDDRLVRFSDLNEFKDGSNIMEIYLANVYRPVPIKSIKDGKEKINYDYSFFQLNRGKINNYLVGLEVIFRNALPVGSSVFRKIDEAKKIEDAGIRDKKLKSILSELGLREEPKPGDYLPNPIIEYSTKLESGDRKLIIDEAFEISGLSISKFTEIKEIALTVDEFITEQAEKTGFVHYDGKIEFIYSDGNLLVCDVVGTFDENRFGFGNQQISKEILRQWYEKNQAEFRTDCDRLKKMGDGWQNRCIKPMNLPNNIVNLVSEMYMAGCNQYVRKNIFHARKLENIIYDLKKIF